MKSKLKPYNLTARSAYKVVGNPANSRLEDSPGNCYPGLELDVRNLDRRFFPGMVFEFAAKDDILAPDTEPWSYGAKLLYLDYQQDPELGYYKDDPEVEDTVASHLLADYMGDKGSKLSDGDWYIDTIYQDNHSISLYQKDANGQLIPLDGLVIWRIVRNLLPKPKFVKLLLVKRKDDKILDKLTLTGWRRRFLDEKGVLSVAYQPGEMTQSLCSPWQHDFRDCGCHYWASNHPDVVYPQVSLTSTPLPDGEPDNPIQANTLVDWLRSNRSSIAAAYGTIPENRPFQMDHFEANHRWQDLNIVLENREIDSIYVPRSANKANPYSSPEELAKVLSEQLIPLEMMLALEYLYSRFSVKTPDEIKDQLLDESVNLTRHNIMVIASSEMLHMRWGNQILWELYEAGLLKGSYSPILVPATKLPINKDPNTWPNRQVSPLTKKTLEQYIKVEHPAGFIDSTYSRVVATLDLPIYPKHISELASRIVTDGIQHYNHFREIQLTLKPYQEKDYLREIVPGPPEDPGDKEIYDKALAHYGQVISNLFKAYSSDYRKDLEMASRHIAMARSEMVALSDAAETLARKGIGIKWPGW